MEKPQKKTIPQISQDELSIDYDKEDLLETLPNLAKELLNPHYDSKMPITGISNQIEDSEENIHIDDLDDDEETLITCDEIPKDPDAIEFLRRCSNPQEALEIISFLEQKNQINKEQAQKYREKLEKEGLDAFGEHKSPGHYERKFRRNFKQHNWE